MFPDAFRPPLGTNFEQDASHRREQKLRRVPRASSTTPRPDDDQRPGDDDQHFGDDEPLPMWAMKITQPAYRQMLDYLLSRPPEAAGLLLGPSDDDLLVTHFVPDRTGQGTPASFELGIHELNEVLKRMKGAGINCKGIGHSHPHGVTAPSQGDVNYLRRVFRLPSNSENAQFFMPIVCGSRVFSYVYVLGRVWRADIVLV